MPGARNRQAFPLFRFPLFHFLQTSSEELRLVIALATLAASVAEKIIEQLVIKAPRDAGSPAKHSGAPIWGSGLSVGAADGTAGKGASKGPATG